MYNNFMKLFQLFEEIYEYNNKLINYGYSLQLLTKDLPIDYGHF